MHFEDGTLDDLLNAAFQSLIKSKSVVQARRGDNREILGAVLHLTNPRARLSSVDGREVVFSCLGEFLWYVAADQSLDFIRYYIKKYEDESEDGVTVPGAYGPRVFGQDESSGASQFTRVCDTLRKRDSTRQAVIQIFRATDLQTGQRSVPCTCFWQFLVRKDQLNMFAFMRSNDAFLGLPHDIFAFTMIQELLARHLDLEIGEYWHHVSSLHLYERDLRKARQYLDRGWQPTKDVAMPPMPVGDPTPDLSRVLDAERALRRQEDFNLRDYNVPPFWKDLIRLLQIHAYFRRGQSNRIASVRSRMHSRVYEQHIKKRELQAGIAPGEEPVQQEFLLEPSTD